MPANVHIFAVRVGNRVCGFGAVCTVKADTQHIHGKRLGTEGLHQVVKLVFFLPGVRPDGKQIPAQRRTAVRFNQGIGIAINTHLADETACFTAPGMKDRCAHVDDLTTQLVNVQRRDPVQELHGLQHGQTQRGFLRVI